MPFGGFTRSQRAARTEDRITGSTRISDCGNSRGVHTHLTLEELHTKSTGSSLLGTYLRVRTRLTQEELRTVYKEKRHAIERQADY
jgi:hypothetical protein